MSNKKQLAIGTPCIRSFKAEFETREENEQGIVEGRPIVFNSFSDFGDYFETIDEHALDNADMTDVRLCLNHDTSFVYAKSRRNNGNSTMQLFLDNLGLRFVAGLNIKSSPKSQDYYSAVKRGDMDKMSFMFVIKSIEWENLDSDKPTARIMEISKIYEISCVTFPAYQATDIEARNSSEVETMLASLEKARKERALKTVETDKRSEELELLKLKNTILGG